MDCCDLLSVLKQIHQIARQLQQATRQRNSGNQKVDDHRHVLKRSIAADLASVQQIETLHRKRDRLRVRLLAHYPRVSIPKRFGLLSERRQRSLCAPSRSDYFRNHPQLTIVLQRSRFSTHFHFLYATSIDRL